MLKPAGGADKEIEDFPCAGPAAVRKFNISLCVELAARRAVHTQAGRRPAGIPEGLWVSLGLCEK